MKYLMLRCGFLLFVTLAVTQLTESRKNSIISFVNLLKKSTNSTSELVPSKALLNEYTTLSTTLYVSDLSLPRDIISFIADKYVELKITPEQASRMIDMVEALGVLST